LNIETLSKTIERLYIKGSYRFNTSQSVLVFLMIAAAFLIQTASADDEDDYSDAVDKISKLKQEIEQDEKCKGDTACSQWTENNMIVCLMKSNL
jgi:hypothetical protein